MNRGCPAPGMALPMISGQRGTPKVRKLPSYCVTPGRVKGVHGVLRQNENSAHCPQGHTTMTLCYGTEMGLEGGPGTKHTPHAHSK